MANKSTAKRKPATKKPVKVAAKRSPKTKLAELRALARARKQSRIVDPRFAKRLSVIKSLADVERYKAAKAAGREPRIDEGQISLFARSWSPSMPLQRLERLVVATAMVQTGVLPQSSVLNILSLWADVAAAPPARASKAASLLSAIGFASLADAKQAAIVALGILPNAD